MGRLPKSSTLGYQLHFVKQTLCQRMVPVTEHVCTQQPITGTPHCLSMWMCSVIVGSSPMRPFYEDSWCNSSRVSPLRSAVLPKTQICVSLAVVAEGETVPCHKCKEHNIQTLADNKLAREWTVTIDKKLTSSACLIAGYM